MTVTTNQDLVHVTIDDVELDVPAGTLVIRAAEMVGRAIPRFCDHPLLEPAGACRQCLVEVVDDGRGRPMPKPQASCTMTVMANMKVRTQATSPVADKAQHGMLEFLLINHPLDCPICDKGGECPLQNQAMTNGRSESRFDGVKRTFPKPINISAQILLDRERCVLCQRCTRFSEQISGDPFIDLAERGAMQQVAIYQKEPYNSYFSGNVIQICPVGALTSAYYRFRSRPFDLVSVPTVCNGCSGGCALRTDYRRTTVMRRLAGLDMEVNEEWNCDRGRFAFLSGRQSDRLTTPLVRENGLLREATWAEAIDLAANGLKAAGSSVGVLTGGRLTAENSYGYAKFARTVVGTNDIDFRARPLSGEETDFLATVAGKGIEVSFTDLESASSVLLVSLEAEEESSILFLRLRKAMRKRGLTVATVAPYLSAGAQKLNATLVPAAPGNEAAVLNSLPEGVIVDAGTVILVGERAAESPGTLAGVQRLAAECGAALVWVPRRAGDRGALDAGCLPTLLPGGRPVSDPAARIDAQAVWGVDQLPAEAGRNSEQMLVALADGSLRALLAAGVEIADLPDPEGARAAVENAGFVVSIEQRFSEISERADVVLPVALTEEQAGTFINWEGRQRPFPAVLGDKTTMTDLRVLAALADALGGELGFRNARQAGAELAEFETWSGHRPATTAASESTPVAGLRLASWRMAIDDSRGNDGEEYLLATARKPVVRLSPATAAASGLSDGDAVTVNGPTGSLTLPLAITEEMVDDVVWLPRATPGGRLNERLGVVSGAEVWLTAASNEEAAQ